MKLTREQIELLSMYTAAIDLGFEPFELILDDVDELERSIKHNPKYYELYQIENECPIEYETPYWEKHYSQKEIEDLNDFEKSVLKI